jgi:PAS domain S-box-containing protein
MSIKVKISIYVSVLIMSIFFIMKMISLFFINDALQLIKIIELSCFIVFLPFFSILVKEYSKKLKHNIKLTQYSKKLNKVLISQSHNSLFYQGNIKDGAKTLTKEVTESIDADRCSIWLYNSDKTSIICQQLYIKKEDEWYSGAEMYKKDFTAYFEHLEINPIIIANNAETHTATYCFVEGYLKPLGIKSMLDVPIMYRGDVIGVVCIESKTLREWIGLEVNFAQMLSSLYSFSYSVKESNILRGNLQEFEKFVDTSVLVSKADNKGRITYVNKKFEEVSGWSLDEVRGKDHSIVNSGKHPKEFWANMYKDVVVEKKIWNEVVTNRDKNGDLYWVDSYIKGDFDENGKFLGYMSIRYDVTDVKKKEIEIRNRMTAINTSNMVIEFDLDGKIMFANKLFCEKMGYEEKELKGKHHKIFVSKEYSKSPEYKEFWKLLKSGEYVTDEFLRFTKDKNKVWIQASYNPVFGSDGKVQRVMKIATDITDRITQSIEIEKKNTYLEHAAKILRHDMHSGINTYIPRGVSSLERRLTIEQIEELKISAPFKMIKDGLSHAQKVYKGVYEFTNLVKKDVVLNKTECNLKDILDSYLSTTSYKSQVQIDELITKDVNESLFCTSIDNLIRNGLKYNDSDTKFVKIFMEGDLLIIQDNGRGITQQDFDHLSKPYTRKEGQKESGTGLGLNICVAILEEHGFEITCEKNEIGTKMKININ